MGATGRTWAVVVAAGRAERFGAQVPKQFAPLAGKPMVLWAVEPFRAHPSIDGVTLVVPGDSLQRPPEWLERLRLDGVELVAGGEERTDSVRLGLETVPADVELVAVHDGARPLLTGAIISRVVAAAGPDRSVIAARRVADTVKEVDEAGRVVRTVNRRRLWQAETPQVFPRELILDVHRRAETDGVRETDCAALLERYGLEATVVEIVDLNLKITTPEDLEMAEAWLQRKESAARAESSSSQ